MHIVPGRLRHGEQVSLAELATETTEVSQLGRLLDAGVAWFEVTAIARDGMLSGPDLALLEQARRDPRAQIVASGGIATVGHLRAVRAIGCAGAIVGRALYDGTLRLEDALAAASE